MDRFGYPSGKTSSYSDGGDRYGFDHSVSSSIPTNDFSMEKKPHFKITVSSTGKVDERMLPPVEEKRRPLITSRESESRFHREEKVVITMKDLEKAFASPWMKDYKHLGESLIHALREESFPVKKVSQPLVSNYLRSQPIFVGCQVEPRSTTVFNGHNIHISIFLTDENIKKGSMEILPFGEQHYDLPHCPITFAIHDPADNDFVGKAHGQIISHHGNTLIRLNKIEDFAKNRITWQDIPVGSNLISTLNIEGSIPISIQTHVRGVVDEESLPEVGEIIVAKPYFEGYEASPKNQFSLDRSHVEAHLELPIKPPPSFFLPIKGQDKKFLLNIVDKDDHVIAYLEAQLNSEGKVDLLSPLSPDDDNKPLKWEDIPAHGLQIILDLDPNQPLSL